MRRRTPNVIRVLELSKAISKVNLDRLAKEVALAMCTKFSERLRYDRYMIAYNATVLKTWEQVAVVQTENNIKRFSHLVCVKFSELETTEFKKQHPIFINLLINELSILGRIE